VLAHVVEEAYGDPELVRTAPHNQAIRKLDDRNLDDPGTWATTWRAYKRKRRVQDAGGGDATGDWAKVAT